jgi:hypothetical protein
MCSGAIGWHGRVTTLLLIRAMKGNAEVSSMVEG